jgi:diacylglycerol kinase
MNPTKNQAFHIRLGYALAGIRHGLKTERSLRVHTVMAVLVLLALIVLRPSPVWWALVIIATVAVVAAELVNTALEHLIDHLHPDIHAEIRIVKDCAAAAVLVTACGAVGVAIAFAISIWRP